MIRYLKIYILLIAVFLVGPGLAYAKDINFEAALSKNKVSLGKSVELNLNFPDKDAKAPDLPDREGLRVSYAGSATRMSVINGQVSSSVTYSYQLTPLKVGVFNIGPITFSSDGNNYTSNEVTLEVVSGPVSDPPKKQSSQSSAAITEGVDDRIFVIMETGKSRAYLNESIPLSIKLYVNNLALKDIQYPEFHHEGFSTGEFDRPMQYKESIGSDVYDVIEFKTNIFATRTGQLSIGPANIKCNLLKRKKSQRRYPSGFDDFFDDDFMGGFFGNYDIEPLDLNSKELNINIEQLPETGKPSSFNGAIGDFDFDVTYGPKEVKVGDPITLKMSIKGEGNFSTVTAPKLSIEDGFKAYEPSSKSSPNMKEFEQILLPKSPVVGNIPQISFSFFNPKKGIYQTITRGPFLIKVTKSDKEESIKIVENKAPSVISEKDEVFGKDILYIKEYPGDFKRRNNEIYKKTLFLIILVLPALLALIFYLLNKRNEKLRLDVRYARKLVAPRIAKVQIKKLRSLMREGASSKFYDVLFEALQGYLGDRFHLASKGITANVVDDILTKAKIDTDILNKIRELFKNCDLARYASAGITKEDMSLSLRTLEEVIDNLQRSKV